MGPYRNSHFSHLVDFSDLTLACILKVKSLKSLILKQVEPKITLGVYNTLCLAAYQLVRLCFLDMTLSSVNHLTNTSTIPFNMWGACVLKRLYVFCLFKCFSCRLYIYSRNCLCSCVCIVRYHILFFLFFLLE